MILNLRCLNHHRKNHLKTTWFMSMVNQIWVSILTLKFEPALNHNLVSLTKMQTLRLLNQPVVSSSILKNTCIGLIDINCPSFYSRENKNCRLCEAVGQHKCIVFFGQWLTWFTCLHCAQLPVFIFSTVLLLINIICPRKDHK